MPSSCGGPTAPRARLPLPSGNPPGRIGAGAAGELVGKVHWPVLGTLEASRAATGNKNGLFFEVNGSTGSIRFNLQRLNELEVCAGSEGFTNRLVTSPSDPFSTRCRASRWNESKSTDPSSRNGVTMAVRTSPSIRVIVRGITASTFLGRAGRA